MTSILFHKIIAFYQLIKHGVAFYGTTAALYHGLSFCQNKDRFIVLFPDTSGNDPRQTFMTVWQKDHKYTVLSDFRLFYNANRFFFSLFCKSFTALVQRSQITCKFRSFFLCLCTEKLQRTGCRIQSSAGIDAWSQHKSHVISCDLSVFQTICTNQFP